MGEGGRGFKPKTLLGGVWIFSGTTQCANTGEDGKLCCSRDIHKPTRTPSDCQIMTFLGVQGMDTVLSISGWP